MYAVGKKGQKEVVEMLLDHGANTDLQNNVPNNPSHIVLAYVGHADVD